MTMKPTPRTDEQSWVFDMSDTDPAHWDRVEIVPAEFARSLERELAALQARLDWRDEAWLLVPREPTHAMLIEGAGTLFEDTKQADALRAIRKVYKVMVAKRPPAPPVEEE